MPTRKKPKVKIEKPHKHGKAKMISVISAGSLVAIVGFGWTANEFLHDTTAKLQPKVEATATHKNLEEKILITGTKVDALQDIRIQQLVIQGDRLKREKEKTDDPKRREDLNDAIKDNVKELDNAKKMRNIK